MRRLLQALWRRRWVLAATTALGFAAAYFLASQQTPEYLSRAQVMMETRRATTEASAGSVGEIELSNAALLTEMQVLRSNLLLERVVAALDLESVPEYSTDLLQLSGWQTLVNRAAAAVGTEPPFAIPADATLSRDQVVRLLQSNVEVLREGSSYAINVLTMSTDPEIAAAISNEIALQYIEAQYAQRQDSTSRIADWLDQRIDTMRQRVDESESRVEAARAEILSTEGTGAEAIDRQLETWSVTLADSRAQLAAHDARLQEYYNQRTTGSYDAPSIVEGNATVSALRQRLADLATLKTEYAVTYGPNNDRIGRIEEREGALREELAAAVERHLVSTRDEAAIRANSAAEQVRELEQRAQDLSQNSLRLRQLERESTTLQQVYSALLTQRSQNDAQQPMPQADARIVARADVPSRPSAPRTKLIAALGGILGLGLGFGGVLASELMRQTYRSRDEVESDLRLPALTSVPRGQWRKGELVDWMRGRDGLAFVEAIRQLRTALLFQPQAQVFMVTSAGVGDGKSTITLATASLFSSIGKRVIVVDCDLRRPSIATSLGLRPPADIVSLLAGTTDVAQSIVHDEELGYDLIVNAGSASPPVDALSTPVFSSLIDSLRHEYDVILLDTAPLNHTSDALAIGKLVDSTVFVLREDRSSVTEVKQAISDLLDMRIRVAGIVLNMSQKATDAAYYGRTPATGQISARGGNVAGHPGGPNAG